MQIRTYAQVDPMQVLKLNMSVLGFPLTPRYAEGLRAHDRRMQPGLCLYAEVDPSPYVLVSDLTHPAQVRDLAGAGYSLEESWGPFMLKSLEPGLDWDRLLGIAQARFYVDCLDIT